MSMIFKVIVAILAVIGLLCVIGFIAMWFMHGSMMSGDMMQEMCGEMMRNRRPLSQ